MKGLNLWLIQRLNYYLLFNDMIYYVKLEHQNKGSTINYKTHTMFQGAWGGLESKATP